MWCGQCFPGALHCIDASFLSQGSFRKLWAPLVAVSSWRQPLFHGTAVLCSLGSMRQYLAYGSHEDQKICHMLTLASDASLVAGRCISWRMVLLGFVVCGILRLRGASPGFLSSSKMARPIQPFRAALLVRGVTNVLRISAGNEMTLLRSFVVGGVWTDFFSEWFEEKLFHVVFVGGADGDGHLFWGCTSLPLARIRENPEFHGLIRVEKKDH